MISRYKLVDVYVNDNQVIQVYKLGEHYKNVVLPLSECYKLRKYLLEVL